MPNPKNPTSDARSTSAAPEPRGTIPLQILETAHGPVGPVRRSRNGPRRAVVLAVVQILMAGHILLWFLSRRYGWFDGVTTTPIEPSESMEFAKHGVINAGLLLFAAALLATLVLGRWFCGWGCHVVLLQDLCGWFMKRLGIRPRPFRSRLLIYVPLILALYMFIWPAGYRWGLVPLDQWLDGAIGAEHWLVRGLRGGFGAVGVVLPPAHLPSWQISWHLTTQDFWVTFPGVLVAVPFLLICGFGCVYFLGAKGYCTYGCPYGGFFAPVDLLAPGRIRVNDACDQSGHCTAVCTSNVRVHEEVREYGMVVDPGCMKCLDCVSVCPNDALQYGFGRPAAVSGPARNARPRRRYDLSWPEEIALAVVFTLVFFAVRNVYGLVPMLMAAGVAGCATFLAWKLWRLARRPDVSLYRHRLKVGGSMTSSGWIFAGLVSVLGLFLVHCGVVRAGFTIAERNDRKVAIPPELIFSESPPVLPAEMDRHADRALSLYGLVSGIGEGGIGLPAGWQDELDMRRARLLCAKQQFGRAEALLRHAMDRDGFSDRFSSSLAWTLRAQDRADEATAFYRRVLLEQQETPQTLADFVGMCRTEGATDTAIELCLERLDRFEDDLPSLRWLSLLRLDAGQLEEGVALIRRTIEIDPTSPGAYRTLAVTLGQLGRHEEALVELQTALELAPDQPRLHLDMAALLRFLGRDAEAEEHMEAARGLQ
jgi:polyferredoxin/Flp pilus assembly protein TadD